MKDPFHLCEAEACCECVRYSGSIVRAATVVGVVLIMRVSGDPDSLLRFDLCYED